MDFARADRTTLERILQDPQFGEALKDRARAKLATLGSDTQATVTALKSKRAPPHVIGEMNKTESRFLDDFITPRLKSGKLVSYEFERVRLRLATRTHFTPDFLLVWADGSLEFVEVKGGYIREDAMVKYKLAAEHVRWASWRMVQWREGRWRTVHES